MSFQNISDNYSAGIMYVHATFCAFLPSIMSQGLIPGRNRNWEISDPKYIYMLRYKDEDDINTAISFCEASELTNDDVYNSGIVVLGLLTEIPQKHIFSDPNVLSKDDRIHSVVTDLKIPANKLKILRIEKTE